MNYLKIAFLIILNSLFLCAFLPAKAQINAEDSNAIHNNSNQVTAAGLLDVNQRVSVLNDLKNFMKGHYALADYKAFRGIDLETIFQNCINVESAFKNKTTRIEFASRVQTCIAKFKDTHLYVSTTVELPLIFTLIESLSEINNKFYIHSVRNELVKLSERLNLPSNDLIDWIKPGIQVEQIDDMDIYTVRSAFGINVSGSSKAFRDLIFLKNFFNRSPLNISKPEIKIKLIHPITKATKIFFLPWWQIKKSTNNEIQFLLNRLNVKKLSDYNITEDDSVTYTLANNNFYLNQILDTKLDINSLYVTAPLQLDPILYTSRFTIGNKKSCYIKTFHMMPKQFNEKAEPIIYKAGPIPMPLSMIQKLKDFISLCENDNLPLLLDARSNPGGSVNLTTKLIELLSKNRSTVIKIKTALRASSETFAVFQQSNSTKENTENKHLEAVTKALEINQSLTDWLDDFTIDPSKAVYSGKIIILTSPLCISACDILTRALSKYKNTTTIGQSTNGTGAGYFHSSSAKNSIFKDKYQIFQVNVPNFLFSISEENKLPSIIENKGTLASTIHIPTMQDYIQKNLDLFKIIENKL